MRGLIGAALAVAAACLAMPMLSAVAKARHAGLTGLIVVFSALGGGFGSLLTGLAFSRFGGITAFYGSLPPMALLLATMVVLRRWRGRVAAGA